MEEQATYKKADDLTKWDERHPVEKGVVVQGESIHSIVLLAIQNKYTPEFIEKMMDLAERNQKNIARQAFFDDLANFKAEAPQVKKDAYNTQFKSWYTSLGKLLDTYGPVLGKHGLSLSFPTEQEAEKSMTVKCTLSHRMGHSESISMTGPIDTAPIGKDSGRPARNPLQNIKSTFTYLRSATCEAILGVAGTEGTEDDDGAGAGDDYITEKQVSEIIDMMNDIGLKESSLTNLFGCKLIEHIPAARYQEAITALKDAKKRKEAKAKA